MGQGWVDAPIDCFAVLSSWAQGGGHQLTVSGHHLQRFPTRSSSSLTLYPCASRRQEAGPVLPRGASGHAPSLPRFCYSSTPPVPPACHFCPFTPPLFFALSLPPPCLLRLEKSSLHPQDNRDILVTACPGSCPFRPPPGSTDTMKPFPPSRAFWGGS